jgi:hypothetical protein
MGTSNVCIVNGRKADSIVEGFFVEPYQRTMPFEEMIGWLLSRNNQKDRKGNIRYVQSQNGNLWSEFQPLLEDIEELNWANQYFGISINEDG